MGKKKSRARVQVIWVSRSHAVLKLHKKVLARLVNTYKTGKKEGLDYWETNTPIPLGAIESIMENPKLANGARFFWDHPRRRGMREPGLKQLERDGGGKDTPGPNRLRMPRLRPKSGTPTP